MFELAQVKPDGAIAIYDNTRHELTSRRFTAFKDAYQHYSGEAYVVRQLKGGMMLCVSADGQTEFKESLSKIRRGLIKD